MLAVGYFAEDGQAVAGIGWEDFRGQRPMNPSDSIRSMMFYLGDDFYADGIEEEDAIAMVFDRPPQSPLYFWA